MFRLHQIPPPGISSEVFRQSFGAQPLAWRCHVCILSAATQKKHSSWVGYPTEDCRNHL